MKIFHLISCVFVVLAGCTYNGYENKELPHQSIAEVTQIEKVPSVYQTEMRDWRDHRWRFRNLKRPSDVFVGVAISGGGSRAANFGAAVLQELDNLGILENVTAISSVSGGSLPAAYYALSQTSKSGCLRKPLEGFWEKDMKKVMQKSFYHEWLWEFANLENIFKFTFTDFNRSDLMAEVFEEKLFGGRKEFGDLECPIPRLFINATEITRGGHRFTFSNHAFEEIGSKLSSFPLSHAIMASSAFPGAFRSIALRNFKPDTTVRKEDIRNPSIFASKLLNDQRDVEKYLRSLVPGMVGQLEKNLGSKDISKYLVWILNYIICAADNCSSEIRPSGLGRSIYKRGPFENVTLSQETQAILDESSDPYEYRVFNRLLLEDSFPEFFLNTLPKRFIHLLDGGPSDNLGVETLAEAAEEYFSPAYKGGACLFIVIDAFPGADKPGLTFSTKTRTATDFLIDTNVIDASDSMLQEKRKEILRRIGLTLPSVNRGLGTLEKAAIGKFNFYKNFGSTLFHDTDLLPSNIIDETSSLLRIHDLIDPTSLAVKLRDGSDPISKYIGDQLSPSTRQLLVDYNESLSPSRPLRFALIDELNQVLQGNSFYDAQRFEDVILRKKTKGVIPQYISLNRLLIEDAYPREIAKKISNDIECLSWHISFDRLVALEHNASTTEPISDSILDKWHLFQTIPTDQYEKIMDIHWQKKLELQMKLGDYYGSLKGALSAIRTHFFLTGPLDCNEERIQELIYTAARVLVHDDRKALKTIYEFFSSPEVNVKLDRFPRGEFFLPPLNLKPTREGVGCNNAVGPPNDFQDSAELYFRHN